jgi:putative glutamine amidotransferase
MSLAKPVIGVTSFVEAVRWGHWSSLAALTPFGYVPAVAAAGGRPVQLPPDGDAVPDLRGGDLVQDLDGGNGSGELHGDGSGAVSEHEVVVREGSRLADLLGARTAVVSEHHQAYGRIGAGLAQA